MIANDLDIIDNDDDDNDLMIVVYDLYYNTIIYDNMINMYLI